ncbi:MAG: lamin tail domain-containing protein [Planctomycetota bacterium]|nr:lamin tail domain-containing protein [Planctomycetota bacterium]
MKRFFSTLLVSAALAAPLSAGTVVINEVHYDPPDRTVPEEFVELHNAGDREVDVSGWFFSAGLSFTFPDGTRIAPGGFLVVAEDPRTMETSFGALGALGPFAGHLASEGETLVLRNRQGGIEDLVDYRVRFPWPLASAGRGSSMERIHPSLEGELGGSWRASGLLDSLGLEAREILGEADTVWRYRKGTSEASDPVDDWRRLDFTEDDSWLVGQTPIGFGDDDDNTVLDDMRQNYSSVYLRHGFSVSSPEEIPPLLRLRIYVDDGAIVWINGVEVARVQMGEGDVAFDGRARRSTEARWTDLLLANPSRYLVVGDNLLAIHAFNATVRSVDFSIDAALGVPDSSELDVDDLLAPPTPGEVNTVFSDQAPPQIRQVNHGPGRPESGSPFVVTARVTDPDGVASVRVRYQIVPPGGYIPAFLPLEHGRLLSNPRLPRPPNPEFEEPANWTTVEMRDDGAGGDREAGDGVYGAVLPGQPNRTLVRYRIVAEDTDGSSITVPYADDKSLNFALFVYDGVPEYVASRRSVHPDGPGHVYSPELMRSLPVYLLISREEDLRQCIAFDSRFRIPKPNEGARDKFNWEAAFVYDGVVYDHMRYRLRQANDRYGQAGKRSMRFRFNKGRYARLRDNYGREYPTRWRTINTGKMFDNKRVGNFGLTETINHDLWNRVGVPAPVTHTFHQRVVAGAEEVPAGDSGQYLGDFWGMFLAFEDYDPRFLDAHGLEDGNLYKLKDAIFSGNELKRNQGRIAVTTDADFQNIRRNLRPQRDDEWLEAHVNYDRWYPYHAVVEGIRHYDFRPADSHSKNRAWYFEPDYERSEFGRVWTLPWDSDASWGPKWNDGIDYSKNAIFAGRGKPAYKQAYRNFLREFRDLLWTDEVINQMVDDLAAFVIDFSKADRDRWRGAPREAGAQDFGPIERKIQDMKNFAFRGWSGSTGRTVPAGGRARHLDNLSNAERDATRIPATPVIRYTGPDGSPLDALTFESSEFDDPQPKDSFAGMEWRLGEISPEGAPFDPNSPRPYEWDAVWATGELEVFTSPIQVSAAAVVPGRTYRIRARMKDDTERWSHWSEPLEFSAGGPAAPIPEAEGLRVTEIMYHPRGDEDYEFIELQNVSGETLDLRDVSFRTGIRFAFRGSDVESLGPGEYVVVVKSLAVFSTRYDASELEIAGEYAGNLSNAGERIELAFGAGVAILDFAYDDAWEQFTDGTGPSLVIRDAGSPRESWGLQGSWRASLRPLGSPGSEDTEAPDGSLLPGDLNQDVRVNITDVVILLRQLFGGGASRLPCGDGSLQAEGNHALVDVNGDEAVNLSDAVYLLSYLFRRGAAPTLGTECVILADCSPACTP